MKSDNKLDSNDIENICMGEFYSDELAKELQACISKDMAERCILSADYLKGEERTFVLLQGGLILNSCRLLDALTEMIHSNPCFSSIMIERLIGIKNMGIDIYSSLKDIDLILSAGELMETVHMHTPNEYICSLIRKLYSKLPISRRFPFWFKVKKCGSKVYCFAEYEVIELKAELENLIKESENRGTKEDLAYSHFYYGIFLFKINTKLTDEVLCKIKYHFRSARGVCILADAQSVTEVLGKNCYDEYEDIDSFDEDFDSFYEDDDSFDEKAESFYEDDESSDKTVDCYTSEKYNEGDGPNFVKRLINIAEGEDRIVYEYSDGSNVVEDKFDPGKAISWKK